MNVTELVLPAELVKALREWWSRNGNAPEDSRLLVINEAVLPGTAIMRSAGGPVVSFTDRTSSGSHRVGVTLSASEDAERHQLLALALKNALPPGPRGQDRLKMLTDKYLGTRGGVR